MNKPETKKCKKCGETKPLEEFDKTSEPLNGDGHMSKCKICESERKKKARLAKKFDPFV